MQKSFLIFILVLLPLNCYSQVYKNWFIHPSQINCSEISVGYAIHSYFKDTTAIKRAFINACQHYAENEQVSISGGHAFWATGIGTFDMGNNLNEAYDTLLAKHYEHTFKVIDTLRKDNFLAVLAGNKGCNPQAKVLSKIKMDTIQNPKWISDPPESKYYYYSVGIAPRYYFEKSSWEQAGKSARIQLASSVSIYIEVLKRMHSFLDETTENSIENQEITVTLHHVHLISRWIDPKNGFHYVLIRMRK